MSATNGSNQTPSSLGAAAKTRLTGFGKSFRRLSVRFVGPKETSEETNSRGNIETKESDEEASKKQTQEAQAPPPEEQRQEEQQQVPDEPMKKASTLEEENLSKILHRRSRPKSGKHASVRIQEQLAILQREQQLLQQQQQQQQQQQAPSSNS